MGNKNKSLGVCCSDRKWPVHFVAFVHKGNVLLQPATDGDGPGGFS